MWRFLSLIKRNMKKSSRVADENMFEEENVAELPMFVEQRQHQRHGLSILYSIIRAPFSIISCISYNSHVNGADGVWVSGELSRISEMNNLMVSDSMRYAIFM
ncbi:hypothetical protein BVC80_1785g42 [Macleaya cordata]|uniref:Uncharacterized protein n=1 Tax=Macleaya cordata TaxID=56857 RepID=A0A200QFP6_MACCD|nr:hypothetical protein BVC80_1785g42 [Macleaya cordata]